MTVQTELLVAVIRIRGLDDSDLERRICIACH
jgi:hypothetical protein